jgi:hypothetical protein
MNVTVNDVVWSMFVDDTPEIGCISPGLVGMKTWNNFTADHANFVIVSAMFFCMNYEIHVESIAIYVSQDVH